MTPGSDDEFFVIENVIFKGLSGDDLVFEDNSGHSRTIQRWKTRNLVLDGLLDKSVRLYLAKYIFNGGSEKNYFVVAVELQHILPQIYDARYYYKPIDLFDLEVVFNSKKGKSSSYSEWYRSLLTFIRRDGTTYHFQDSEGETITMTATQRWSIPDNKPVWVNYRANIEEYGYRWNLIIFGFIEQTSL
jgi:hypothetical protein